MRRLSERIQVLGEPQIYTDKRWGEVLGTFRAELLQDHLVRSGRRKRILNTQETRRFGGCFRAIVRRMDPLEALMNMPPSEEELRRQDLMRFAVILEKRGVVRAVDYLRQSKRLCDLDWGVIRRNIVSRNSPITQEDVEALLQLRQPHETELDVLRSAITGALSETAKGRVEWARSLVHGREYLMRQLAGEGLWWRSLLDEDARPDALKRAQAPSWSTLWETAWTRWEKRGALKNALASDDLMACENEALGVAIVAICGGSRVTGMDSLPLRVLDKQVGPVLMLECWDGEGALLAGLQADIRRHLLARGATQTNAAVKADEAELSGETRLETEVRERGRRM